jgi:hypothetical protein
MKTPVLILAGVAVLFLATGAAHAAMLPWPAGTLDDQLELECEAKGKKLIHLSIDSVLEKKPTVLMYHYGRTGKQIIGKEYPIRHQNDKRTEFDFGKNLVLVQKGAYDWELWANTDELPDFVTRKCTLLNDLDDYPRIIGPVQD